MKSISDKITKINRTTIKTVPYLSQHVFHSLKELKKREKKMKYKIYVLLKEALILL